MLASTIGYAFSAESYFLLTVPAFVLCFTSVSLTASGGPGFRAPFIYLKFELIARAPGYGGCMRIFQYDNIDIADAVDMLRILHA